jgi:O-antigen ligase
MELAWSMFRESPLVGGGPGAFEYTARHHPERWLHTHATLESMYPYVLANYGAIGVLAFLATLGICVGVWRGLPRRRGHPARTVGLAVVAAGIGLLAAQVGENTIFHPKINWTIGMLLGLLRVLRHPSLREERPDAGGGAWAAAEA